MPEAHPDYEAALSGRVPIQGRLFQSLAWGVAGFILGGIAFAFSPTQQATFSRSMVHCGLIVCVAIAGLAACGLALSTRRFSRFRKMYLFCALLGLLDILLIIPILGVSRVFNKPSIDPEAVCRENITRLENALDQFYLDVGRYPHMDEGLTALELAPAWAPNWNGPYILDIPRDPWGHGYQYLSDGRDYFEVYSMGPDGKIRTSDDISGWEDKLKAE